MTRSNKIHIALCFLVFLVLLLKGESYWTYVYESQAISQVSLLFSVTLMIWLIITKRQLQPLRTNREVNCLLILMIGIMASGIFNDGKLGGGLQICIQMITI